MSLDRSFALVQARAFNAHDAEAFAMQAYGGARVIRDGRLVGEGRKGLQEALEAEAKDRPMARVLDLDGEPVLVEYDDHEAPTGVIRLDTFGGRVREVRIDHDEGLLARFTH